MSTVMDGVERNYQVPAVGQHVTFLCRVGSGESFTLRVETIRDVGGMLAFEMSTDMFNWRLLDQWRAAANI